VKGQEQPVGEAKLVDGALVTSFVGYQPRTFALKLGAARATVAPVTSQSVDLKYDLATASNDDTRTGGDGMDGKGDAFPAEMLPAQLTRWRRLQAGTCGNGNSECSGCQRTNDPVA
jgi:alpha-mannosidase